MPYKIYDTPDDLNGSMLLLQGNHVVNGSWTVDRISDTIVQLPPRHQSRREEPVFYHYLMDVEKTGFADGDDYNDILIKARQIHRNRSASSPIGRSRTES